MREIKFKYYFENTRYGGLYTQIFTLVEIENGFVEEFLSDHVEYKVKYRVEFTGLSDEQGVEIYEGDIQKQTFGEHYWIYVVKSIGGQFGNTLFSMTIKDNLSMDEDKERYTYAERVLEYEMRNYVRSGKDVEVIGNIYENKELLDD